MKKRIARIQRWLNRLTSACENKNWDSAMAVVDCLGAEVRDMREAIASDMLAESQRHSVVDFGLKQWIVGLKILTFSMLIVMLTTLPLAVEADKPWSAHIAAANKEKSREDLHWVTQEELELLQVLRADLSQKNRNVNSFGFAPKMPTKTAARKVPIESGKNSSNNVSQKPLWAKEDILALVQIGERAIRGDSSAITVVK